MNPTGPQLEDGYFNIANELFDAILRAGFSKRELLIVLAVIRKTYGYRDRQTGQAKKSDDITMDQLANMTGLARTHTTSTVSVLVKKRVVLKRYGRHGQTLGINKHYYQWRGVPKRLNRTETVQGCTETVSEVYQNGTDSVPKRYIQKTTPKDNPKRQSPLPPAGGLREILGEYPQRPEPINEINASKALMEALRATPYEEILAAVKRYAAFCDREGRIGTRWVMSPIRFLGERENIENEWAGEDAESDLDDETRERLAAHA